MEHFITSSGPFQQSGPIQQKSTSIPLEEFYAVDVIVPGLFHITVLFLKQLNIWFVCL